MPTLIGLPAPEISSPAILADGTLEMRFSFDTFRAKRRAVVFFYSLAFAHVCPTELLALHNRMEAFASRNVAVAAVSVDSFTTLQAWRRLPPAYGGLGPVSFPLVSDLTRRISREYGVLLNDTYALRGTFILDAGGRVRHQLIQDFPFGRDIDMVLHFLDAMAFHDRESRLCPAGWREGKEGIVPTEAGVADFLSRHAAAL